MIQDVGGRAYTLHYRTPNGTEYVLSEDQWPVIESYKDAMTARVLLVRALDRLADRFQQEDR